MKVSIQTKRGFIAFFLGVGAGITANLLYEAYKDRKKELAFGDKKIIEELKSSIIELKEHINQKV